MKQLLYVFALFLCTTAHAIEIEHELGVTKFEETPTRVVALNWSLTETLIALGVTPTAMADIEGYKTWVSVPELPDGITDVGIRREPNLEAIKAIKPDLILISKELAPAYAQLNAIAPTVSVSVFNNEKQPITNAKKMTEMLGKILGKEAEAKQLIAQTDAIIATNAKRISSDMESLLFIRFLSERTVRVHSEGSLLHDTIKQMGLTNTWQDDTNIWGFTKAGVSKLAKHQDARVLVIGPLSDAEQAQLKSAKLWQLMAFSKENRVHILPAIWTYGSLVAAQRFSEQVALSLTQ